MVVKNARAGLSRRNKELASAVLIATAVGGALVGCGNSDNSAAVKDGSDVVVKNCGQEVTYKAGSKMLVNDGNIVSFPLALGLQDQLKGVSSVLRDESILITAFGDGIKSVNQVAEKYPTLENIIAAEPDVFVAGWGYGFSEDKGITPAALKEHGIDSYILTESCRQGDDTHRGIVDPWEAVKMDLANIGAIAGASDKAEKLISELDGRLAALDAAPRADKAPVGFVFDSANDAPFTSGRWGAPQGILEKAGAKNATESIEDTWTTTNWEFVAQHEPDFIVLVEYPAQSFEEKIKMLQTNPATKDMAAVKEKRFVNLPYAMWTESPLNVDAAEHVRKALEKFGLVPTSDVKASLELPKDLPGLAYFK